MSEERAEDRTEVFGARLQDLFSKRDRPMVVEIGCGVGLHPIQYATQNPSKSIVAIERTSEKFQRFLGRLEAHPHLGSQICAVHGDAIHFLDQNFADSSIDEVWLLYPNPEVKKASRRWFRAPFMKRLVQLMKPDARLYFATNLKSYADECLQLAPTLGLINIESRLFQRDRESSNNGPAAQGWHPRSHFEKKYFERGETLYDFQFRLQKNEAQS